MCTRTHTHARTWKHSAHHLSPELPQSCLAGLLGLPPHTPESVPVSPRSHQSSLLLPLCGPHFKHQAKPWSNSPLFLRVLFLLPGTSLLLTAYPEGTDRQPLIPPSCLSFGKLSVISPSESEPKVQTLDQTHILGCCNFHV